MNNSVSRCSSLFLSVAPTDMLSHTKGFLLGDSDGLLLLFMFLLFGAVAALKLSPGLLRELSAPFIDKEYDSSRGIHIGRGLLLCFAFAAIFLLSLFAALFYSAILHEEVADTARIFKLSGGFALSVILYYLYKWGFNCLFTWTFYSRGYFNYWMQCFSGAHLLAATALLPFLFIALFLYGNELHGLLYFMLVLPSLAVLVVMAKSYFIFFKNMKGSLYFILYLCAQELCPLLLLGSTLDFFYNYLFEKTL